MRMHMKFRHNKSKKVLPNVVTKPWTNKQEINKEVIDLTATGGGNDKFLCEDMSFSHIQEDISIETISPKAKEQVPIQFDWLDSRKNKESDYKSGDREKLMNHILSHLNPKTINEMEIENMYYWQITGQISLFIRWLTKLTENVM